MAGGQSHRRPQLISLLEAVSQNRTDLSLDHFSKDQIEWAIETGLGPVLFRALENANNDSASTAWRSLKAADLTARILMGIQFEAMREIIDGCCRRIPPLILIKGISIGEELYPEPHLRLMRDLDFLVTKDSVPAVEAILQDQGYRRSSKDSAGHHDMPFFHEAKDVWVEVHHGLFSGIQRAATNQVFHIHNVFAEIRPSSFQGRAVFRLSSELQLVYLACHWAQAFQAVGGAISLVDAIYLLKRGGNALRWGQILKWVDRCVAATYLYLLLNYLDRYRLVTVAPEIMHQLFHSQPSFRPFSLKAAMAIIDRYLIEGKNFGAVLSLKNIGTVWQVLTLPSPFLRKLILRKLRLLPVDFSLPV
jgi:hypothetical protein